jgi:hypothetical protein
MAVQAVAAVPPHLRVDKDCEIYGLRIPKGSSRLKLELECYRTNRLPAKGGLGAEEHFKRAWRLAWPKFQWNEWVEMLVWAWCNYRLTVVIGHTRASKTFGTAHAAYLDYCAAPFETMTSLTTVTFEGLKIRMWADLMMAIESASFACPFVPRSSSNEMKVIHGGDSKAEEKFIIEGFATSKTKDSAGRIQGKHARRRRALFDEAQELPDAIYRALANAMSAPDFKGSLLANPVDKLTEFGAQCEPEGGWGSVHDTDLYWKTKDGNVCLHFDGLQSPNMKAGKVIFDFLIRPDYIEEIRRKYGEDSLEWWMYVRGFFPPDGTVARVWTETLIERAKQNIVFDFKPTRCASLDPAFEHDDCVLDFADYGKARDGQNAFQAVRSEKLLTKTGRGVDPKDYQIAHQVKKRCEEEGVKPCDFIMDKTGGGRGVFAILQKEWSYDIHGIEYGGAATGRLLKQGETDKCEDLYLLFVTELYFRTRAFAEENCVGGLANLDPKTVEDLTARRYTVRKSGDRSKTQIETKPELKKRLGRSPDYGDTFSQFGELMARKGIFPGKKSAPTTSERWKAARGAAIRACKRYQGEEEFRHF